MLKLRHLIIAMEGHDPSSEQKLNWRHLYQQSCSREIKHGARKEEESFG